MPEKNEQEEKKRIMKELQKKRISEFELLLSISKYIFKNV